MYFGSSRAFHERADSLRPGTLRREGATSHPRCQRHKERLKAELSLLGVILLVYNESQQWPGSSINHLGTNLVVDGSRCRHVSGQLTVSRAVSSV